MKIDFTLTEAEVVTANSLTEHRNKKLKIFRLAWTRKLFYDFSKMQ